MTDIVQKLWGFCHTLRHDGIDYGDYIEQLTYLLFLKMADERGIDLSHSKMRTEKNRDIEIDCSWPTLAEKSGTALTEHYVDLLRALGQQPGLLGDIFASALSRFTNPVNLKKLIGLIDETEWTSLDVDVKAAAFEGLLEKAASEGKKGAGQYFTPRILIQTIVRCMKPDPRAHDEFTISDPACGITTPSFGSSAMRCTRWPSCYSISTWTTRFQPGQINPKASTLTLWKRNHKLQVPHSASGPSKVQKKHQH
jgi:type I restriction enzyme M protein